MYLYAYKQKLSIYYTNVATINGDHICEYIDIYVCKYVYMYVCIWINVYVYTQLIHIYVLYKGSNNRWPPHIWINRYMYMYMYIQVYVYVYVWKICTGIHTTNLYRNSNNRCAPYMYKNRFRHMYLCIYIHTQKINICILCVHHRSMQTMNI